MSAGSRGGLMHNHDAPPRRAGSEMNYCVDYHVI
jgi:hypothetical protein